MPGVPSATDKIEKPVRDRNCPRTTSWKFDVSSIFTRFVQQAGGGGVGVWWGGKGRAGGSKGRGGGVVRGGGAWWSQCIGRYRPTLFVGAWLVYLPIGIYFREKDVVAAMGSIVAAMSVTAFCIPFPKNQFFLLIQQ